MGTCLEKLKEGKMRDIKFAVIGAGHGGKAMAAYLALKDYMVNLYNRTYSKIEPIVKMKGIELEGEVNGFGRLNYEYSTQISGQFMEAGSRIGIT